jgi:hypothetical protein
VIRRKKGWQLKRNCAEVEDEAVDQEAEKRSQKRILSTRWSLKKRR